MTDLAASCADLAALLPAAAVFLAEQDTDGSAGSSQPGSQPPWNADVAMALFGAIETVRRLEASLRRDVTGRCGPRRGGSDANTYAAIAAIPNLAEAVSDDASAAAAAILGRRVRRIRELRPIDEAEPWRRVPAPCPYCGVAMLRVRPRAGEVTCLRHGACFDGNGQHPVGRMDVSRVTGDALITWADGLVTP